MAKNMQPIAKRCKALGISPAVMGYDKRQLLVTRATVCVKSSQNMQHS